MKERLVIVTHDTGAVERICDKAHGWATVVEMLDKPEMLLTVIWYMGELDEKKACTRQY